MKEKSKSFFLLTGSILVMAIGIYFFKFANNFTFGGITGLAVLVAKTGVMSASDFTFIMNMLLLLIGLIVLGKTFALTTAYCSILLSVLLSLLERIFPMSHPLTDRSPLDYLYFNFLWLFSNVCQDSTIYVQNVSIYKIRCIGCKEYCWSLKIDPCKWKAETVAKILARKDYLGHTVN